MEVKDVGQKITPEDVLCSGDLVRTHNLVFVDKHHRPIRELVDELTPFEKDREEIKFGFDTKNDEFIIFKPESR